VSQLFVLFFLFERAVNLRLARQSPHARNKKKEKVVMDTASESLAIKGEKYCRMVERKDIGFHPLI